MDINNAKIQNITDLTQSLKKVAKQANSQVDVTPAVEMFAANIPGEGTVFARAAMDKIWTDIRHIPYDKEHEVSIRWRRTADQIVQDRFVYQGKSCTDEVVTFIALSKARGYEARFVKLNRQTEQSLFTHSVAELRLLDGWYMVDVNGAWGIRKGFIQDDETIHGFKLWRRGRDAWDIGLFDFGSQTKMMGE